MHQICRHIRTSGGRCRSVAIANQNFCYYHLSQRRPTPAHLPVDLPPLEDRGAIQIAISRVLSALAAGLIERRDAGMYLYGIQIAASNLGRDLDRLCPENDVRRIVLTRDNKEIAAPETYMDEEDDKAHEEDWDHYACTYIEADNPAQPHHPDCRCGECEQRLQKSASCVTSSARIAGGAVTEEPQALTIRATADNSAASHATLQEICHPERSAAGASRRTCGLRKVKHKRGCPILSVAKVGKAQHSTPRCHPERSEGPAVSHRQARKGVPHPERSEGWESTTLTPRCHPERSEGPAVSHRQARKGVPHPERSEGWEVEQKSRRNGFFRLG